jgi:hypothetical protein
VQSVVSDKHMSDDMLLDSVDGLITMLAGPEALAPLSKYGNAMQAALGQACPKTFDEGREVWDESCNITQIEDTTKTIVDVDGTKLSLVDARTQGVKAFGSQAKVGTLSPEYQKLLATAAELELTLQMVTFHAIDDQNNPKVSFALNYRFDDKALGLLATAKPEKLKASLRDYFATVSANRPGFKAVSPPEQASIEKTADAMAALLTPFQERYAAISANESQDLPRILEGKPYVKLPVGIRFDVSDVADANSEERMARFLDDEKRIRVESISHQRAILATDLFDALMTAVEKNIDFTRVLNLKQKPWLMKEQAAAYTLMSTVSPKNMEVGMDVGADLDSKFWQKRERFVKAGFQALTTAARGSEVEAMSGKMFDVQTMMNFTRPQK